MFKSLKTMLISMAAGGLLLFNVLPASASTAGQFQGSAGSFGPWGLHQVQSGQNGGWQPSSGQGQIMAAPQGRQGQFQTGSVMNQPFQFNNPAGSGQMQQIQQQPGVIPPPPPQAGNSTENTVNPSQQTLYPTNQGSYNQGIGIMGGDLIEQAAEIIGIDEDEIIQGLKDGQSLAEIAADNDVDEEDLLAELVEMQSDAIDEAVDNGIITDDQADTLKDGLQDRLETMIETAGLFYN